jgi:hypothetical protein
VGKDFNPGNCKFLGMFFPSIKALQPEQKKTIGSGTPKHTYFFSLIKEVD